MRQFTCLSLAGFVMTLPLGGGQTHGDDSLGATRRFAEHHDLSYYQQSDGTRSLVRTPEDWNVRRRHILAGMEEAMGPLPRPAHPLPVDVEVLNEHDDDGIRWQKLAYHTDRPDYKVRAWLLMPSILEPRQPSSDRNRARRPAVLCLHQTTAAGKDAPVGLADRPSMHYALELARRGYVTLSPDYPSFGEHEYDFDTDAYASGSMKAVYDNIRAIDLLQSLPEVDPRRIGCIGHSLGGHNALFTAVFDNRIRVVVTSCGFTSFHKYCGGDLRGWSGPRYMPRVATRYGCSPDKMPFDFPEVLAAIAPRAVFIVAPLHDDNFDVAGVRDCVAAARPIYDLFGHAERLRVVFPDCGHDFPKPAPQIAGTFLDERLISSRSSEQTRRRSCSAQFEPPDRTWK